MITGKLYDRLKYLAQIVLPALGTLYFTLASIWNLGSGAQVVGSIMAVDLFLGVILGISQINYNKQVANGVVHAEVAPNGVTTFTLDLHGDPADLPSQKEARFKVQTKEGV